MRGNTARTILFCSVLAHHRRWAALAEETDVLTGLTPTGEQCSCPVPSPTETDETSSSSSVVITRSKCDPTDVASCTANCVNLHGPDSTYLNDKCCIHAGQSASLLAFEEDSLWVPRIEEFNKCTGAEVRLEYLAEGEDGMADALVADLGADETQEIGGNAGQGLFDAYIVQAPWLPPVVNGLENLTPLIRENADTVQFLDINPASRSAVSYNGTVRALPLDSDYIALGWRADVFHKHNIPDELSPPRTIQELAEVAEMLNGLDHNDDGEGDWGVCLTPQVNYFYAFVAPLIQSALRDPNTGTQTGQNMFFTADTFTPLLRVPAFRTALELYWKIIRNSNCQTQLPLSQKCDRKKAFPTGRCAMVISMPGTLTKMLLDGAKYAPEPRIDSVTNETLWDVNEQDLGDKGSYWGRRAPFPGSKIVTSWDAAEEGSDYPLVECSQSADTCPTASDDGINYAPFFAEGGEAYALNGRQAKASAKRAMWDMFTWLSELPVTELPLSGQYRQSHLSEEHKSHLMDEAGWPVQMVDDLFDVLGRYFKSEEEGGNAVQDLLMLGFSEYMSALDEELHEKFLGVAEDSTSGLFDRSDPSQSIDPQNDKDVFDTAFNTFVDALEARYDAISSDMSGGHMGQLQRWRQSLNLPWRTDDELCVGALESDVASFQRLNCPSIVDFASLCQTQPELVARYDDGVCASIYGTDDEDDDNNAAVLVPAILVPLVVLAGIVAYVYVEKKKRNGDSIWAVKPSELHFDDPPTIVGRGTFGLVLLAEYRGTNVAVKRVIPPKFNLDGSGSDAGTASTGNGGSGAFRRGILGEGDVVEDMERSSSSGPKLSLEDTTNKTTSMNGHSSNSSLTRLSDHFDPHRHLSSDRLHASDPNSHVSFNMSDDRLPTSGHTSQVSFNLDDSCSSLVLDPEEGVVSSAVPIVQMPETGNGESSVTVNGKSSVIISKSNNSGMDFSTSTKKAGASGFGFKSLANKLKPRGDEYEKLKNDFIVEMRHLSKLRHPCITTVMGAVIDAKEEPMLVMEYCEYGSLYDVLHNETMPLDGDLILHILRDIAQGVRFLHAATPQVIHGDLKAANILVDGRFRAKVADFGLSQKKEVGATGTPLWMAPELLCGESDNTAASDVYSFGIILYEVYSRKDPYDGESFRKVIVQVANPKINKRPPIPDACPPAVSTIMKECVESDPRLRPTFEELDLRLKRLGSENVEPGETPFAAYSRKKRESKAETLLYDVFPPHIADALREGRKVEQETHECITLFFSDIVGFTVISQQIGPQKVADMLDRLYNRFDELSHKHDIFKIETIGDAYMASGNLVKNQSEDHTKRIAQFSIDAIKAAGETLIDRNDPSLGHVRIRVGFHCGPVIADVVGSRLPKYGVFGDTVNTASRMESNSLPGCIHCSEVAADLLKKQAPDMNVVSRGKIRIKGKGIMHTFWVDPPEDIESGSKARRSSTV